MRTGCRRSRRCRCSWSVDFSDNLVLMKGTVHGESMDPVFPFDLTLEGVRAGGLSKALHRQLRTAILERRLPVGYVAALDERAGRRVERRSQYGDHGLRPAGGCGACASHAAVRAWLCPLRTPNDLQSSNTRNQAKRKGAARRDSNKPHRRRRGGQPALQIVYGASLPARSFRTGVPEHRYFDHDSWRRLTARALRCARTHALQIRSTARLAGAARSDCGPRGLRARGGVRARRSGHHFGRTAGASTCWPDCW